MFWALVLSVFSLHGAKSGSDNKTSAKSAVEVAKP
jgi:hypothetical protein